MINDALAYLGRRCQDPVTGFSGVIDAVSFDLYGCVQVEVRPKINEKGEMLPGSWFDINRIRFIGEDRVLPIPTFEGIVLPDTKPENYPKGAADKPSLR